MKNIWFSSDLHFDHRNICEFADRPWIQEDNTTELVDRWNACVGMDDDVYHLGDFTFDGHKHFDKVVNIIKHLNGNIHFILGNHCERNLWQMIEDANIPHVIWIKDYARINIEGQMVVLSHFPHLAWDSMQHGSYHLFGHMHGSLVTEGRSMDVGIDAHANHQLFSWTEVKDKLGKRPVTAIGHHVEKRK